MGIGKNQMMVSETKFYEHISLKLFLKAKVKEKSEQ